MSHFIMSKISIPRLSDKRNYWTILVKPTVQKKYITLRSNFDAAVKHEYNSEFIIRMILYI